MQLTKQVMWAYAARNYTVENPRTTKYVEVNIPEALPTIPQLPLLSGTTCPTIFGKGTKFMVLSPTERIEDAYIIYA